MNAHDWRDICAQCHAIVEMPLDGSAADHLCPLDVVTIATLRERVGLTDLAAYSLKDHILDLGEAVRLVDPVMPPAALDVRRTGPFLPASPPPICFVGDLLLWTRQDLAALPNVGRHSIKRIMSWLARYGYTLAERDHVVFRTVSREQLSEKLLAVRRYMPEAHDPFSYDQRHIVVLPDDELPAGESRTIEFRAEQRLRIAGLFIPPAVAFDILLSKFHAGNRDLIVGNATGHVIEPGEVVSLTVENVSQRTIRLIGTLQVDVAVNVLDEIPASPPLPPFVGSQFAPQPPPNFPSGPWPWLLTRDEGG